MPAGSGHFRFAWIHFAFLMNRSKVMNIIVQIKIFSFSCDHDIIEVVSKYPSRFNGLRFSIT